MPTIRQLLTFHANDCGLFERLINFEVSRDLAEKVMSLWMWLESSDDYDSLIQTILYSSDEILRDYLVEASRILDMIKLNATDPGRQPIPLTSSCGPSRDLNYYFFERNRVLTGVGKTMMGIGRLVFDDTLREIVATDPDDFVLGTTFDRASYERGPVDLRSIIIVMTQGRRVSREAILHYFTSKWGDDCIEDLVVEHTTNNSNNAPVRVKVLFKRSAYLELAFGGDELADFRINGRKFQGFRALHGEYFQFY